MALKYLRVKPGDLIKADQWNSVLDGLEALEAIISGAGQGDQVVIEDINLISPHMGDELRISGRNFGYSTGAAVIVLDTTLITAYKNGTSDRLLIFDVPTWQDFPEAGKSVLVLVSNGISTVTRTITVLPRPVVKQGNIDIAYKDVQPSPITAGKDAVFHFQLVSRATLDATLKLTPNVSTGWPRVKLLDDHEPPQELPSGQLTVLSKKTRDFYVSVPIPDTVPKNTPFSVSVDGVGSGYEAGSGDHFFSVGQTPIAQADYIDIVANGLGGATVTLAPNASTTVALVASFSRIGKYNITVVATPSGSGWLVDTSDLSPNPAFDVTSIPAGGPKPGWMVFPFRLGLTAPATVPSQAVHLVITIWLEGEVDNRELSLSLVVKP